MELKIRMTTQNGDRRIQYFSSFLVILLLLLSTTLVFLLIFSSLLLDWFVEGSEIIILGALIAVIVISVFIFYSRKSYYKIIFNDQDLSLCSKIPFVSRKVKYHDILRITINKQSAQSRIETREEFFKIDNTDISCLISISNQKELNVEIVNVA